MKKPFFLLIVSFLLTACSSPQVNQMPNLKEKPIAQEQVEGGQYQEIETQLKSEAVEEFNIEEEIATEIKRLEKEGQTFWHDSQNWEAGRVEMPQLRHRIECTDGIKSRKNCSITGLLALPDQLSEKFKLGTCGVEAWDESCLVIEPPFPKDLVNQLEQEAGYYAWDGDFYTVGAMKKDDVYSVYKNDQEIFSDKMLFGTESVISDFVLVNNKLAFTYNDLEKWMDENNPVVTSNIFYDDETINEKYKLESSAYPFGYKGKLGFLTEENDEPYFFFNGQRISENFDKIRPYGCCAMSTYPIKVDEKGILFFMAKRGETYYFVEVDLNKYL